MGDEPNKPNEPKQGDNSTVEDKPDYKNEPKPGQQPKPQQPNQPPREAKNNLASGRCCGPGLVAISATALNVAINGSIFPNPESSLAIRIPVGVGTMRALPAHHVISDCPPCLKLPSTSLRSTVLIAPINEMPWRMPASSLASCVTPIFARASTMPPIPIASTPTPASFFVFLTFSTISVTAEMSSGNSSTIVKSPSATNLS